MAKTETPGRAQSAGLKWRPRAKGPDVPSWYASPAAIRSGYPVKTANLSQFADNAALLVARAERLQAEMLMWMAGATNRVIVQNGTFLPIFDLYETDPESTYKTLKPGSLASYVPYLRLLRTHIGHLRIDDTDGRDIKRWFADWRKDPDGSDHLPRARMVLSVLKAAISFAVICRVPGAVQFQTILRELEFEAMASRTFAPTAEQVTAMRAAAHAHGAPERALMYAIQYEATSRQWDVIGQWVPLSDPKPSAVLGYGKKWIGLEWRSINENLILENLKPTKTERTTKVEMSFDLSACPMVMEELAHWPQDGRRGPVIVNPKTGLPYTRSTFQDRWHDDFLAAGMPEGMWNRDLRAGGITEGGKAGASKDDRKKLAGHTREETTESYDRGGTVIASRRVMEARANFRKNGA